jgi:hypothetical protein
MISSAAGMPSIPHVLFHALWGAVVSLLAGVGLRPLYVGMFLAVVVGLSLIGGIYGQMTGRIKFTLEPTEFQHLVGRGDDE